MKELLIMGAITLCIFGVAFYQSYRDKQRWKRIASGMSLFGRAEDIPPLVLDGISFEPHERNVLLIWADQRQTAFYTVADAKQMIERSARQNPSARRARGYSLGTARAGNSAWVKSFARGCLKLFHEC